MSGKGIEENGFCHFAVVASEMRVSRKPFKKEEKLAAIELWQASVPLVKIRSQLGISKATLKRVLAFAKANPANPIKPRMPGSGKQCKVSDG